SDLPSRRMGFMLRSCGASSRDDTGSFRGSGGSGELPALPPAKAGGGWERVPSRSNKGSRLPPLPRACPESWSAALFEQPLRQFGFDNFELLAPAQVLDRDHAARGFV